MKKKKISRLILFVIITYLVMPLTAIPVYAAVPEMDYLEQFNKLVGSDYAEDDYLTREDFCVAVSKIFIKDYKGSTEIPFVDVDEVSEENKYHLGVLYRKKILAGVKRNGKVYMRPNQILLRQEAATLLGKALSKSSYNMLIFSDEDLVQPYAYRYVTWFVENGIDTGHTDGSFGAMDQMTAGELAILTINALKYDKAGMINIETAAGTGTTGHMDGKKQDAGFTLPYSILCDKNGQVIVFDTYSNAVRTIRSDKVETLTGGTTYFDENGFPKGYYTDGTLSSALFNRPTSGVFNSAGELIFADSKNNVIRHIKGNTVYTYCGTTEGHKDGSRDIVKFNSPMAIAIDKNDNIYVADTLNNCIRKIDKEGKVTTIAGIARVEGYKDGNAKSAMFRSPAGIAVNDDGSIIYVADTGNHRIRKIEDGKVTTIAGNVSRTDGGDPLGGFQNGVAAKAEFNLPRGIIVVDGIILIADSGNNMIRAVTKSENVVTVAGNGEAGDMEGSCMEAVLNSPSGLSYQEGSIYIADTENNKIKKMAFDSSMYQ